MSWNLYDKILNTIKVLKYLYKIGFDDFSSSIIQATDFVL